MKEWWWALFAPTRHTPDFHWEGGEVQASEGISRGGRLGSTLACIHLMSCQVWELLSKHICFASLIGFILPCFGFCWREAYMKISMWGWSFTENVHPCRQLNLDVLAQFFGRDGVWLTSLPSPISLACAFLDNAFSGEWNDSIKDGRLEKLFLTRGIAQRGSWRWYWDEDLFPQSGELRRRSSVW